MVRSLHMRPFSLDCPRSASKLQPDAGCSGPASRTSLEVQLSELDTYDVAWDIALRSCSMDLEEDGAAKRGDHSVRFSDDEDENGDEDGDEDGDGPKPLSCFYKESFDEFEHDLAPRTPKASSGARTARGLRAPVLDLLNVNEQEEFNSGRSCGVGMVLGLGLKPKSIPGRRAVSMDTLPHDTSDGWVPMTATALDRERRFLDSPFEDEQTCGSFERESPLLAASCALDADKDAEESAQLKASFDLKPEPTKVSSTAVDYNQSTLFMSQPRVDIRASSFFG